MNPANIFGRAQSSFPASNNASQNSGLFQGFSQQGTSGTTTNIGFGHNPTFGQPSAFTQPAVFGQMSSQTSVFGQTPSFGTSVPAFGQPAGFGQNLSSQAAPTFGAPPVSTGPTQAPVFGQQALSQATPTFGAPPASAGLTQAPAFGQQPSNQAALNFGAPPASTGPRHSPAFGQQPSNQAAPTFGAPPASTRLTQTPAFGQQALSQATPTFGAPPASTGPPKPPAFGQQPSNQAAPTFGAPPASTGPPQPPAFGQQPSNQAAPTFGAPTASTGPPQPPAFGQQPSNQAAPTFGTPPASTGPPQPPAFGQQPSNQAAPTFGAPPASTGPTQPPAFGQQPSNQAAPTFGAPPASTGPTQPPAFGQPFGSGSAFSQPSGFGQPIAGLGRSSNNLEQPTSSVSSGGSQPGFGQSTFAQPPPALGSANSSMSGQSKTQTSGIGSQFSFKPLNETSFKPIFSVGSIQPKFQAAPASEHFGVTKSDAGVSDSSGPGSSLFSSVKPNTVGFNFSQPGAVASVTVTKANVGQTGTLAGNTPQFTFSQPANPSSNSSITTAAQSTTVPSSPSSFSFSAKVIQSQPEAKMPFFGTPASGKAFTFKDPKLESPEVRVKDEESRPAFGNFGKTMKRKEEQADSNAGQGRSAKTEESQGRADSPRHPPKRPLLRTQGATRGLFQNALSDLKKESVRAVKKEWAQENRPDPPGPGTDAPLTPPRPPAPIKHVLEKAEKDKPAPEPTTKTRTPARAGRRRSSEQSPFASDATALQCKGIPANFNQKQLVKNHFEHFGKVTRVYCKPNRNLAIVHFLDHESALKARKMGKHFHGTEIQLYWQRKKPTEQKESPAEVKEVASTESESKPEGTQVSQLRKPLPRPPAVGTSGSFAKGSPVKKTSLAKTLQFDADPQQDVSSESQSMDRPGMSLLSSIQPLIGQVAETAEEKYRLLEQRDKILRQSRPKRTDLDLSKVFVGTCPDMCPEKERYMRETRNQLSIYELVPDTEKVDHHAAIKEYSRSSADQEEPLPHELRPLPVLSMTMDYLVTQIMDQGEDNYRDWYDFVWNRTRGIRKDITQQHLCDPVTVSLIEKCTRFHVHCAHHLCQEPMMSFDAKINNENMTKCLQSLKEMYQDLATKGVYCVSEAEFRQYNVLLKLNDGDILREVQQFRKEVRDSAEVKFAVQAFAAFSSNNFVRFFKLVKAASYLASCILHRYFNQVRRVALKALSTAYTASSQRSTLFPVEDLVRMLMFRSSSEAAEFVQLYGLNVTDGMVELSRMAYQEPDLPVPQKKSVAIEKKKTMLIGEVVNGGPLPNPPAHMPICSFDAYNKFRGDAACFEPSPAVSKGPFAPQRQELKALVDLETRPQIKPRLVTQPPAESAQPIDAQEPREPAQPTRAVIPQPLFQPIVQPQPIRPPSPKKEPAYSDQDLLAEVESVVKEVVDAEVLHVAKAGAEYVSAALGVSECELETVVSEVLAQMLKEVSSAEVQAEKTRIAEERHKLEEARRRQELEAFLDRLSAELCADISQEVLSECTRQTAAAEIKLALEEKAAHVARCTAELCDSLVEETLVVDIGSLAQEVLDVELRQIRKFIKRWRDVVAVRRQLKRQMRGFPAAPCCVDPRFKVKAWVPSAPSFQRKDTLARGLIDMGNTGKMAVSCTRLLKVRSETIHRMRVDYCYNLLLSERVWSPLDLPTLVAESTPNPPDRIFWKAALLLPSDQDDDTSFANSTLTKWLEVKLSGRERTEESMEGPEGKLETLLISNSLRDVGQKTHKVHLCVKVSRGPLSEESQSQLEDQKELLGTSALLMLLPPLSSSEHAEKDVPLLSALLQLKQVQQASGWNTPLPLVLLIPNQMDGGFPDQKIEEALMLQTLVQEGLISEYILVHVPGSITDLQGSEQIGDAVRWMVAHSPASAALSCRSLQHFVEGELCQEFYRRFYQDKQERARAALHCQEPSAILQLYNSVLGYLADVVSSDRLAAISWPPPEFALPDNRELVPELDWNSSQHLTWLKRAVLSLRLPEWDQPPQNAPWPHLCKSIFRYVSKIPSSPQTQPLLMSRLENLLAKVRARHLRDGEDVECDGGNAGPSFIHIPWDDILILCIEHRLKDWHVPESPATRGAKDDILVYFYKDQLKNFLPPQSWVAAVRRTHKEAKQNEDGLNVSASLTRTPATQFPRQRLFQSRIESEEGASVLDITHSLSPQELLPHRLLSSIQKEKAQSQRFEEQLQRWLEVDPLESVSLPLFVPSTLLSVPEVLAPKRRPPVSASCLRPEMDTGDASQVAMSLAQRMQELDRLILANREEELTCSLKLKGLLGIVDD